VTSTTAEPVAATFEGGVLRRTLLRWTLATRPKFLTASVLPVLVGTAWGARSAGSFDGAAFALALLATVCLHAAANVFNDVGDELGGSDRINADRIHPYTGGSRFIQNGVMSLEAMLVLSGILLSAALALGGALAALKGIGVVWLGLGGIALGLAYSLPLVQLSGRGIGEVAVAIAFGALPVTGAAWLQSGTFGGTAAWVSVPVSLWVAAILLINEVPDRVADAAAGKRTLPVRLGVRGSRWLYAGLHAAAAAGIGAAVLLEAMPAFVLFGMLVLFALGVKAATGIGDDRDALKRGIEMTLMIHAAGCVWLLFCAYGVLL
jgi:1,4-dihydroxy-2-naphthoate octaprenyltransferase